MIPHPHKRLFTGLKAAPFMAPEDLIVSTNFSYGPSPCLLSWLCGLLEGQERLPVLGNQHSDNSPAAVHNAVKLLPCSVALLAAMRAIQAWLDFRSLTGDLGDFIA